MIRESLTLTRELSRDSFPADDQSHDELSFFKLLLGVVEVGVESEGAWGRERHLLN